MRALVADDDAQACRQLQHALAAAWPGLKLFTAVDGIEAWDGFLEHEPEVCFLDVRMPGLTGIEVAQRIGDRGQVVLLAAPSDRVLPLLEAGGVPHLTKPLDTGKLVALVAAVRQRLAAGPAGGLPDLQHLLDRLAGQLRRPAPVEVLEAGDGPQARLLNVDDVVYFEAEARCTRAVSADGEALIRTPLKALAARLDPQRFRQIHRHLVVNERHILAARQLDADTMVLSLRDHTKTLPVGRHFQPRFRAPAAQVAGSEQPAEP